ncbi:MAG: site-2 protease family protein, partial [Clostridia bacterium]|nr:site-2 protease family protein [Clostridia bacterium]
HNFGRLSLNPLKHIDPFCFIFMLLFHFGWAKPVPINSRYFKKPRRDMALTAAAGPASNVLLSIVFAAILRILLIFADSFFANESSFKLIAVVAYMLYMGIVLNFGLAIFNLIPIPPFDGSRIFYTFLPVNLYFKVMKYERYIMVAILLLLYFTPFLEDFVSSVTGGWTSLILKLFGLSEQSPELHNLGTMLAYVTITLLS